MTFPYVLALADFVLVKAEECGIPTRLVTSTETCDEVSKMRRISTMMMQDDSNAFQADV